jgi:hypothetical protein
MSTESLSSERDAASELPADLPGARPSGQGRAGPGTLFLEALALLRRHGLRALGLALVVQAVLAPISTVPFLGNLLSGWWYGTLYLGWLYHATWILFLFVVACLGAMYARATLRLVEGRKAGVWTLFSPITRWRLVLNVTLAGAVATVGPYVLHMLWYAIPWDQAPTFIAADSPLMNLLADVPGREWLARELARWIPALIVLPAAWAGLDSLVRGVSWTKAVRHSAALAWRNRGLALAYFVITALLPFIFYLTGPLVPWGVVEYGWIGWCRMVLANVVSLFLGAVKLALGTLALVVIYREMVWREREAGAPPSAAPSATTPGA